VKRLIKVYLLIFFTIVFSSVRAENYQIDDKALDQVFSKAQTISITDLGAATLPGFSDINSPAFSNEKDPLIALLLDLFLGGLGIHRFYLGTEPITGIAYILTCGGIFGIVPLVDLVVLAVNFHDISPYIDNPKFFMW